MRYLASLTCSCIGFDQCWRARVWLKSMFQVTCGCPVAADASVLLKQELLQQELEKFGAREVEVRLDQEGEGDSKGRGF